MRELIIPASERFDSDKNEFVYGKEVRICIEHSLISLSKWESKHNKPFLSSEKSSSEMLDYIKCMTLTSNIDDEVYLRLSPQNIKDIQEYIQAPMTATTINHFNNRNRSREIITSEIIYYWMIALNIPVEFQKWHLNRLLTLIEVCSIKNEPPKKMSTKDIIARNRAINAANRRKYKTKG